jgi:hypothetical protein
VSISTAELTIGSNENSPTSDCPYVTIRFVLYSNGTPSISVPTRRYVYEPLGKVTASLTKAPSHPLVRLALNAIVEFLLLAWTKFRDADRILLCFDDIATIFPVVPIRKEKGYYTTIIGCWHS